MALMLIHIIRSRLLNWFLTLCKLLQYICTWGGGGGVTPYSSQYGEALPFSVFTYCKGWGILLVEHELYERIRKSVVFGR